MKAAVRRKYGMSRQIKIEQIQKPIPKDNEILIKVHATTVNRTDCANLTAKPFIMRFALGLFTPREKVIGTDFSGEIISMGKKVTSFDIGDRVFGFNDTGSKSHAEYISITPENLFLIPDAISYKEAAASLEAANYAYTFIHKVAILPGQHILINGATGGIGSALLQFVKQYDVIITATCNTKNTALIKALGADKVVDYTQEDFTNSTDRYDHIFDAVGKSTFGKCKPLLGKKGVYISSELGPYAQNLLYPILTAKRDKRVVFPMPYSKQLTIPYICKLLTKGTFKPVIDREYALENISEAYAYVLTGEKIGNVLINIP